MRASLKLHFILLASALAATASANGAMGYALEFYAWGPWFVYVVVTVVFEAYFIGRGLGDSWLKSVAVSLIANGVSAFSCMAFAPPFIHSMSPNPNPILITLEVFGTFALCSAIMESFVWRVAHRGETVVHKVSDNRIVIRSFIAHGIGIPLALLILLAPKRPYPGIESMVNANRWRFLNSIARREITNWIVEHNMFPTREEFAGILDRGGEDTWIGNREDAWTVFYAANYHRFDTHEMKRSPAVLEWNPDVEGKPLDSYGNPKVPVWLVRRRLGNEIYGLVWDGQLEARYFDPTFADNADVLGLKTGNR